MKSLRFKILAYLISFLCLSVVVMTTAIGIRTESHMLAEEEMRFEEMLDTIEVYLNAEKNNLEEYRQNILTNRKDELRNLSLLVQNYFDHYHDRFKKGELSEKKAKEFALKGLTKFTYGNNDYFFVFDSDLIMLSHPIKKMIGIDAKKVTDKRGKFHIREIMENAQVLGEGTSLYHWNRLGEEGDFEKLGYGIIYRPWNWLIISGVYIDDIEMEVHRKKKELINSLETLFISLQKNKDSYTYVFDGNGKVLIHPVLKGVNLRDLKYPNQTIDMFEEHLRASKLNTPFEYKWNKPNDLKNYEYNKTAFIRYFKPFGWYIAHSVYSEDLSRNVSKTLDDIILISILCVLMFIPLAILIAQLVYNPIKNLTDAVKNVDTDNLGEASVRVEGPREVEELSKFMQNLVNSIHDTMTENKALMGELAKHKTNLEKTVGQRTSELNKKNENLRSALTDLNKFKDQLVAQEKLASLGALSAGIAHEIKNPLNLIVNSAKLIVMRIESLEKQSELSSDISEDYQSLKDLSDVIIKNSNRSERIIHSMLQQSRTGENESYLEVDIEKVVDEYWNLAYHSMRANNPINVSFHKQFDYQGTAFLIEKDFGRLLLNLFENSFYALQEKRQYEEDFIPQVWVYVNTEDDNLIFRIKDNGPGIEIEQREKILEPFYTTKPAGQGTGLGLSMVHDIVMAHKGKIDIKSVEGEFTEFAIIIPMSLNKISEKMMVEG